MPLWRGEPENIVGVLHTKHLAMALIEHKGDLKASNVAGLATPPWFVPETTTLEELIESFRQRRSHFALVVDEYGGLQGLVTLEDILGEIFGELPDEHQQEERPDVRRRPDGSYLVDGTVPVRDLNRELEWNLPDEGATTVAGLVIQEARTIPEPGQRFAFFGYKFEVLQASAQPDHGDQDHSASQARQDMMRQLLVLLLAVLATPALADDITLSGHIDAAMAANLHLQLADGKPHTVHINSSGGDDLPALALAEDIHRAHAGLIVDGLCAGPCANDLFVAATERSVMPGGLVIFAASATSRLAMVPSARIKEVASIYPQAAQQEKQLFAAIRIDPALLREPQLKLATSCWSLTSRNPAGQAYINYQSQFVGWIPSRAYLTRAGVRVGGFWPANDAQFDNAVKNAFPGGARGAIAYSGAEKPSAQSALVARLAAIKECPKR